MLYARQDIKDIIDEDSKLDLKGGYSSDSTLLYHRRQLLILHKNTGIQLWLFNNFVNNSVIYELSRDTANKPA